MPNQSLVVYSVDLDKWFLSSGRETKDSEYQTGYWNRSSESEDWNYSTCSKAVVIKAAEACVGTALHTCG